jgi:hypothetical protein
VSKTSSPDDIAKIKKAINECDAYGSVSIWLYPDGHVDVVSWHGGESATQKQMAQGTMRLHWDPKTFIVQYTPPMTPLQGVAMYDIFENVRNSNVEIMVPGAGITGDRSGNPKSQMETLRGTKRQLVTASANPSPAQIKEACWSKGFFELMADVFGSRGNDPVHGGCRLVMEALKIVFPSGEKYATINDRGNSAEVVEFYRTHQPLVQHYVLKVGGQYLDGNGAHTEHEVCTDEELGGWLEIPNLMIPATPALIEGNRGIICPPGAAQKAATYILDYKG